MKIMNKKVEKHKIVLSIFFILALICNFLPLLEINLFITKVNIKATSFFNTGKLEELMEFFGGDTEIFTVARIIVICIAVLNLLALVTLWRVENKVIRIVSGLLAGVVQAVIWIYVLVKLISSGAVDTGLSMGLGLIGFVVTGVGVVIVSVYLLVTNFVKRRMEKQEDKKGALIGVSGEYAGGTIPVGNTPVIIGRDQNNSHIIISGENVSRRHCSVAYDATLKMYIVRDFSSNGTYLANGKRLSADRVNELMSGDEIRIGKNNVFRLK